MSVRRSIFYVAYPLLPVSEESCGGAEQMLAALEQEMERRGHLTTVAACRGSRVSGELFCTGSEVVEPDAFEIRDEQHRERVIGALRGAKLSSSVDLVHDKSGHFWRCAKRIDLPVLATLHLPRNFYPEGVFSELPENLYFNCVSATQSHSFADIPNMMGVVRNAISTERFPFRTEKQPYLLWMGRICQEKGPHLAIEVARRTGLPLILAGQVYPFSYHENYYAREIRPYLGKDDPPVLFLETPTFFMKQKLLSEARAVLIPSLADETSSLVAMEAMACGTPVIGFRRGAIPEVVLDGETGFAVDGVEQMADAVWRVGEINPHACRAHVEANYSAGRMADEYEELYSRVLQISEGRLTRAA